MRLSELDADVIADRLNDGGLGLDVGAARICIRSDLGPLAAMLQRVYGSFESCPTPGLFDVTVDLRSVRGLRSFVRPQIELWVDGGMEFERFPRDTPLPLLEWGINFALASRLCCYLLLHAGSVERNGHGLLLPAMPGSGKSTLTAALSLRGYRLLSDEFGVVRLSDRQLLPLLRPIALKNESIDVIRSLDPSVCIGPPFPNTRKGTVAHLAPKVEDVEQLHAATPSRFVVFPQFVPTAGVELNPVPRARSFARLVVNSFNYDILGPDGFDALGDLLERSDCYELRYGNLELAIAAIDQLFLDEPQAIP